MSRCEASCQRLHNPEVVIALSQTIPSGHRAAHHRMYNYLPPTWGSAGGDCLIPRFCGTNKDHKASTGKMAKALAEFKFSH
jgi:hypothetical protein